MSLLLPFHYSSPFPEVRIAPYCFEREHNKLERQCLLGLFRPGTQALNRNEDKFPGVAGANLNVHDCSFGEGP